MDHPSSSSNVDPAGQLILLPRSGPAVDPIETCPREDSIASRTPTSMDPPPTVIVSEVAVRPNEVLNGPDAGDIGALLPVAALDAVPARLSPIPTDRISPWLSKDSEAHTGSAATARVDAVLVRSVPAVALGKVCGAPAPGRIEDAGFIPAGSGGGSSGT